MKKRWGVLIFVIMAFLLAQAVYTQTGTTTLLKKDCNDTEDNDGDYKIDYPTDPGCTGYNDDNESDIIASADNTPPALDMTGVKVIRYSVNPTIEVEFTELVKLDSAYLYAVNDETNAMLAIGMNPPPIPVTNSTMTDIVNVKPLINLFNGLYDLVLTVQDLVGNSATVHQKFIIDVPATKIKVTVPRLGVSNGQVRDIVINTSREGQPEPTDCKITSSAFVYDFNSAALVPFDIPLPKPSIWHKIENFFDKASFSSSAAFYILCMDRTWNRVNRERFEIYVDTTPPAITAFRFSPPKVIEYPEFGNRLWVILNVSANEPVMCKYSINESKEYGIMERFPGFDTENFYAYTKSNNTAKVYLADATPASYDFYVQCEDRAGWKTEVMKGTLQVDLSAAIGMNVIEPKQYTTNKTITLKMTTEKRAICMIGNSSVDYSTMATDTTGKNHAYFLGNFEDGKYVYNIKCTGAAGVLFVQEQEMSYEFTVDNTKPSAPNMTGAKVTCLPTKFYFVPPITLLGNDLESGILYYLYKMETTGGLIINWTKTKDTISIIDEDYKNHDLNLSQKASYKIVAKSVNSAGLESAESSYIVVYDPNDISCFEKNPPIIILAKNETEGKTIVEIACEDESGCNNESYYYGLCDTESCQPTTNLKYPFMIDIYNTKYLAYNVSDIHGYSATGTEKIEVKEGKTCGSGAKDGDETDIDCGGSCEGCDDGKACLLNTDCSSNYCEANICKKPACDDNVTNGPYGNAETDVDCGGYCGATCGIDRPCSSSNDCASGFCLPSEKKCALATCEDGYKNGNETGIDCGGECTGDCEDKDGDGIEDAWEEKYCNGDCNPGDDIDKDGLTNLIEFNIRTDPIKYDTDGDGYSDGEEYDAGTDPLDPESYPRSTMGILLLLLGILFMIGGSGYLVYKKYYVEKPLPAMTRPGQPGKTPEQIAEERKRQEELQRRLMEQRRKQLEESQKRAAELRKRVDERRKVEDEKKKGERDRLFGKFGEVRAAEKTAVPSAQLEKPKMPIPGPKSAFISPKPGVRDEGNWVSFDKLKGALGKITQPLAKPKEDAQKDEDELSKLESITREKPRMPKKDVFEEMKEISGDNDKDEDIYERLEDVEKTAKKKKKG